jgi:hypothetical protein
VQVHEFVGILKRAALAHNLIRFLAENRVASKKAVIFAMLFPFDKETIAAMKCEFGLHKSISPLVRHGIGSII